MRNQKLSTCLPTRMQKGDLYYLQGKFIYCSVPYPGGGGCDAGGGSIISILAHRRSNNRPHSAYLPRPAKYGSLQGRVDIGLNAESLGK